MVLSENLAINFAASKFFGKVVLVVVVVVVIVLVVLLHVCYECLVMRRMV